MATEEEIYKIIMKVENEDKVRALSAAVDKEEAALRNLISTLGAHDAATKASAASLGTLQSQLKAAEGAAGIASHKVMALGQTLDDLQYVGEQGLRPIINNVMQLSPVLGMAMIGVQLLYSNWDNLSKLLGQGHVKTQAEEMEELGKKTSKTADETLRLAKAERERKTVQDQHGPTTEATKAEGRINEAIKDAPVGKLEDAAKVIYDKEIRAGIDPQVTKQRDDAAQALRSAQRLQSLGQMGAKQVDNFKAASKDADDEYAKHYKEQVEKKLASMTDPAKLHEFVGQLDKRPDLKPDRAAMKRLRDAARTPQEIADEQAGRDFSDATIEGQNAAGMAQAQRNHDAEERDKKLQTDVAEARMASEAEAKAYSDKVLHKNAADHQFAVANDHAQAKDDQAREGAKAKQSMDKAKAIPGVEDALKGTLVGMGGGRDAENYLAKMLAPRVGAATALEMAREQGKSANEELMTRAMKEPDRRSSQVIGVAEFAKSIQSSVGKDDTAMKQLKEAQNQGRILNDIRRNTQGAGGPRSFGGDGALH
jgi:hypothetical protein